MISRESIEWLILKNFESLSQMTARRNKSVTIARRLPRSNVDLAAESGSNWAPDPDHFVDFAVNVRSSKEDSNANLKTSSSGEQMIYVWELLFLIQIFFESHSVRWLYHFNSIFKAYITQIDINKVPKTGTISSLLAKLQIKIIQIFCWCCSI